VTSRFAGDPIVGVLLAAGSASRFGGGKLLAPLEDGTLLGVRALINLAACVATVVAVVRPDDVALARALASHGARVTVCPYAANGMGQSLAWAIRATPLAKAWLVALCGIALQHLQGWPTAAAAVDTPTLTLQRQRALEAGAAD